MNRNSGNRLSFWMSLPGTIMALIALIVGMGTLIGIFFVTGVSADGNERRPEPTVGMTSEVNLVIPELTQTPGLPTPTPTTVPTPTWSIPMAQVELATSQTLETWISEFLFDAINAEIAAYTYDDISYLYPYMQGEALGDVQAALDYLRNQGLIYEPEVDFEKSSWVDIRQINEDMIEADTCEYWSGTYYNRADGTYSHTAPYDVVPQTITIEWLGEGWFITKINFYPLHLSCE
jgi:hypothetical protein